MHAHQIWWVWLIRFRRYGYLSKTTKFPFWGMDYSLWSSKNLIFRNQLKKFMQVGIDVKFMHTYFGGRGFSSFEDISTFKNDKISLSTHGLQQSMVIKNINQSESAKKFHASRD